MKPVMQKNLSFKNGDCFSACIASILEILLDQVPNFHGKWHPNEIVRTKEFHENLRKWAKTKGFLIIDLEIDGENPEDLFKDMYIIANGLSARATKQWHHHAVVWKDGKIVHDPHPMQGGPKKITSFSVFICRDPQKNK